ncbi:sun protein [Alkaliphilus metalliredigens QYMF]|uniref:16S rRNA (cytosine(967)-C(5))-methyltransferase n=1 Tax=Alkaliphilus metalliredigens (strain QYMF) TaxID=293826 RepID=A6TRW4_ALKMQ|nr:16S rRNA (cytosine(967)-C(5))-methyltransferase RsmB [Alkaliphilus metalliredigens]ABR48932.1 sun protein [Alkaliphilus metalliredigens QYMF]
MKARESALKVLYAITEQEAYSNIALNQQFRAETHTPVDKAFVTELVYGVVENLIWIDYVIDQFSTTKTIKMNPWTLSLLRLAIYQIFFLDRVPVFAAVNESVDLSKKYCKHTTAFINGVLRNILRKKEIIRLPDKSRDLLQYLSVKYSHPKWLVQQFMAQFDDEFTESLLKANNERPDLYVRVNTLKISIEDCITALREKGITVEQSPYIEEALKVKGIHTIEKLDLYLKGQIYIQDFSSMLVARIMDPHPGALIMDVCSAPGGKATHLAQLMGNQGEVVARDVHEHKLKLIKENVKRLGVKIIKTEVFDAKELDPTMLQRADGVLIDAPCSGLGIIRRKPEIKYRKKQEDIKELQQLQIEILNHGAEYVKPGGTLVYSTCTIDPRENHHVIKQFLKENNEFELEDINEKYKALLPGQHSEQMVQLYPHVHHTDGFFIAKLIKK